MLHNKKVLQKRREWGNKIGQMCLNKKHNAWQKRERERERESTCECINN
jgi:hypothetical protein